MSHRKSVNTAEEPRTSYRSDVGLSAIEANEEARENHSGVFVSTKAALDIGAKRLLTAEDLYAVEAMLAGHSPDDEADGAIDSARGKVSGFFKKREVPADREYEFANTALFGGARGYDFDMPAESPLPGTGMAESYERAFEVDTSVLRESDLVAFVHNADIRDFHDASFDELERVAGSWLDHENYGVSYIDDVSFILTDAYGFDYHVVISGAEHAHDSGSRFSETANFSGSGDGSHEDAVVAGVEVHASAITQQSAATLDAGRVDSEHADSSSGTSQLAGQSSSESAFADAGWAREANLAMNTLNAFSSQNLEKFRRRAARFVTPVFDEIERTSNGDFLAPNDAFGEQEELS